MMNYEQQLAVMDALQKLLSIVDLKHSRYGLMGNSIIVRADIGPHCADQSCNERLILSLFLGSEPSSSIASPHTSLSGLITGLIESLGLCSSDPPDSQNWNSANSSSIPYLASGLSMGGTGETFPDEFR